MDHPITKIIRNKLAGLGWQLLDDGPRQTPDGVWRLVATRGEHTLISRADTPLEAWGTASLLAVQMEEELEESDNNKADA